MREILFRGKRIEDGEWVEGDFLAPVFEGIPWILPRGEREEVRVIPETVGQCTGLCDKNGKKMIFEGDIVTFKTRTSEFKPCYVRWYEEDARFLVTMPDGVRSYPMDMSWDYEILGTIHDNPELLEVSHE